MPTEPVTLIAVPDSVMNAVEEALSNHLPIMKQYMDQHRDRADRVSWAVAHYRNERFHSVWSEVQHRLHGMEGLSPETIAEIRSHVEIRRDDMPRSKANAATWAAQKAEAKREREARKAGNPKRRRWQQT